jgi:malate dehydrogenase
VLRLNAKKYADVGKALNDNTKRLSRTVVIGGPSNLNAMVALTYAKNLPHESITSMTRLYQEQAMSYLGIRTGHKPHQVKKLAVWGNTSTSMFIDTRRTSINHFPID